MTTKPVIARVNAELLCNGMLQLPGDVVAVLQDFALAKRTGSVVLNYHEGALRVYEVKESASVK